MEQYVRCRLDSFSNYLAILLYFFYITKADNSITHGPNILKLSYVTVNISQCPEKCTCESLVSTLNIECRNRKTDKAGLLAEIDKYLEDAKYENITTLEITYSILDRFPLSVCRLKYLKYLVLDDNEIVEIPANCITKVFNLEKFHIERNNLTYLPDGLFDGLWMLTDLSFKQNRIGEIGLHTFSNKSDLVRLKNINLKGNNLTTLEPWPFIRGQVLNGTTVDLADNRISNFTNQLEWSFNCTSERFYMNFDLTNNKIQHISDLLNAFGLTAEVDLLCLYGSDPYSTMYIKLDGADYICDCIDFSIYSIVAYMPSISILDRTICSAPPNLFRKKIISVPLDDFFCNVTENCPTGCKCSKQPAKGTFHVYCENTGKTNLPYVLPPSDLPLPKRAKYELNFPGNAIDELDYRSYFTRTKFLDVSNSGVRNISDEAWLSFRSFSDEIRLNDNRLISLPLIANATDASDYRLTLLSVHGNPFRCDCEDLWEKKFLLSMKERLSQPSGILCASPKRLVGRSLLNATDDDFCYVEPSDWPAKLLEVVLPAAAGAVLLCVLLFGIAYKCRIRLYSRFHFHIFNIDECEGEDMEYDVFLCSAAEDSSIAHDILTSLEDESFKICYHRRDFSPGRPILYNILEAISRSKRVLCLVTDHFLQSTFCMLEFREALMQNVQLKKHRLIILKWPDIRLDESDESYDEIQRFLSTHTYIEREARNYLDQLMYWLPVNRLGGMLVEADGHEERGDEDDVQLIN